MHKTIFRLAVVSLVLVAALGCACPADFTAKEPAIPDSPDGAVYAFAESIQTDHAEHIWKYLLPEGYKSDINEMTKAVAEKLDPDVYDQGFAIIIRAIEVLDDRKEIIFASETFKSTGADADEIRTGLSNTQVFTETLKASKIATLEGLGSINWEQFLATTVNEFLQHAKAIEAEDGDNPLNNLDSLKVETIDESEDMATLRISTDDHEPEEVKMVKVEGRWIPDDLASEWDKSIDEARQGLAEMTPETMAAQKTQIMMFFGMATGLIDQIASLQTSEEFDAAMGPLLAGILGGPAMDMGEDEVREMPEEDTPEQE